MRTTSTHRTLAAGAADHNQASSSLNLDRLLTGEEVLSALGRYPRADHDGRDQKLGLLRIERNVWAPRSWWLSLKPWQRCEQEHYALSMAARRPLIFCRESAALLHGWPVLTLPRKAHTIIGHHGTGSHRTDRCVQAHSWSLGTAEVQTLGGAFVTTPARTAADCSRELAVRDAVVVLDHYVRVGGTREAVEAVLQVVPNRRGVRRALAALARSNGLAESPGETLTRLVLEDHALLGFEQQVTIATAGGRHRVDFAWVKERVVLEFDGGVKYMGQFGTPEAMIRAERQREKDLTNAGWRVIRVNWDTIVRSPLVLVELLRAELGRAGR